MLGLIWPSLVGFADTEGKTPATFCDGFAHDVPCSSLLWMVGEVSVPELVTLKGNPELKSGSPDKSRFNGRNALEIIVLG